MYNDADQARVGLDSSRTPEITSRREPMVSVICYSPSSATVLGQSIVSTNACHGVAV